MEAQAATEGSPMVELLLKTPSRPLDDTFRMQCNKDASIGDLKGMIQASYPGNPAADSLTVRRSLFQNLLDLSTEVSSISNHYMVSMCS